MIEKIKDSQIILSWGVTVALAWLLTPVMAAQAFTATQAMYVWTALMAVPLALTGLLKYRGDSNKIFDMWALLVTLLMIENFLTPLQFAMYSYFHVWFIAGAFGFYYTSKRLPPPSKKTYRYAAYASIAVLPAVFYRPLLSPLIAIFVQGGPILYDWYTVHR
ncbi:hypothetical protein ACK3SF_02720 [Candidatus Nanosalina sp. VS9-1]|uniref:hypothetical protein n=1 Tax=Candidatus Nanosalina sp. VS9-1 TaxID=3388566 RepID=UPI0039DF5348